jgi:hypothetical protein
MESWKWSVVARAIAEFIPFSGCAETLPGTIKPWKIGNSMMTSLKKHNPHLEHLAAAAFDPDQLRPASIALCSPA